MMNPVFYIAEAPTFSAGEIMIALLILAAVLALFIAVLIVGIKGFYRVGRGERDSLPAKVSPLIGALDVLFLVGSIDESVLFAIFPLASHAVSFFLGWNWKRTEPPAPPTG